MKMKMKNLQNPHKNTKVASTEIFKCSEERTHHERLLYLFLTFDILLHCCDGVCSESFSPLEGHVYPDVMKVFSRTHTHNSNSRPIKRSEASQRPPVRCHTNVCLQPGQRLSLTL